MDCMAASMVPMDSKDSKDPLESVKPMDAMEAMGPSHDRKSRVFWKIYFSRFVFLYPSVHTGPGSLLATPSGLNYVHTCVFIFNTLEHSSGIERFRLHPYFKCSTATIPGGKVGVTTLIGMSKAGNFIRDGASLQFEYIGRDPGVPALTSVHVVPL